MNYMLRRYKSLYVNIDGVYKSFFKDNKRLLVLDNVNFSIEKGSFVSIVGPSGCGKSTLLNLIAGLEQPDKGAVYINKRQVTKPGDRKSTRLNSSHVAISYAVFCLKKK